MRKLVVLMLTLVCTLALTGAAHAKPRKWTSANGVFSLHADAIAFNDTTVVLKKEDGSLVAVQLQALAQEDRDYVESKEAKTEAKKAAEEMQTWTSADGMKVRGQVVAYGRKTVQVGRQRGQVTVNGKRFSEVDPLQQKVLLKVLSRIEKQELETEKELLEWAKSLGGSPKSYTLDGVLMRLESGDRVGVPFFMFSEDDLAVLEPGWKLWLEKHESEDAREDESFLVRAQAMAYQRDRMAKRQIELLKLELLATATGATDIWQVGLVPAQGRYGRPLAVMVTGRNSQIAAQKALARYPGYVVGGIAKASN